MICSFLPRPLEQDAAALKVPFFHRNTDYDEFIFYHDGDFFSRDNIKAGMATLHPRGIHHGPHPKALANQGKKAFTDESAVMLDGLNPIDVLPAGGKRGVERILDELDGEEVEDRAFPLYASFAAFCFVLGGDPIDRPPPCRPTVSDLIPHCR